MQPKNIKVGMFAKARNALSRKFIEPRRRLARFEVGKSASPQVKKFIGTFEAGLYKGKRTYLVDLRPTTMEGPFGVALITGDKRLYNGETQSYEEHLMEIKLNTHHNTLVIGAIQGKEGARKELADFASVVGESAQNHLIKIVEDQAIKSGFAWIAIPKAETLQAYKHPVFHGRKLSEKELARRIKWQRTHLRNLYKKVAESLGYTEKGEWFVKELKLRK